MEWWMFLLFFISALILVMSIGIPIAYAFLVVNFISAFLIFDLVRGTSFVINSMFQSVLKFTLTPVPLFILMGAVLFHSGLAISSIEAISKWIGKVPGRLTLLSLGGGALFSNLSGSAVANTAVLGSMLIPEMRNKGYSKQMTYGPIMGAAGLAIVIPPSAIAILLGSIGQIPVGPLLMAGIIPGFIMALLYVVYVVARCYMNPQLAPAYETEKHSLQNKIYTSIVYIGPLFLLIAIVICSMFFGISTPTEAAAIGALGAFILAFAYGRMNWLKLLESMKSTIKTTAMIMLIIASASAFSQLLSITGATRGMVNIVSGEQFTPLMIMIIMILIVFILGMFLEQIAIIMVALPVFVPMIVSLGYDPIWFGAIMLVTMEIGTFSPPFGMILFVMRGVAPPDVSMNDIYKSAYPFIAINLLVVVLLLMFPLLATWLPGFMYE